MHVSLLTYGSRGDVEPFVALGRGLQQAGHTVRLAVPEAFCDFAGAFGLDPVPLPGDPDRLVADLVQKAGRNPARMVAAMARYVLPLAGQVFERADQACSNADLVVHSFLLTNAGHEIARRRGVPDISAQLFPVFYATREFAAPAFPDLPLGGLYRLLTHRITTQVFWRGSQILYGRVRKNYPRLPPLSGWPFAKDRGGRTPIFYGLSRHVIPRPSDWDDHAHITGYWFLDPERLWQPPDELLEFLDGGSPPIYIGFGSTIPKRAERLAREAIRALELTGQRGVLALGRGGLKPPERPDQIHFVDSVPHSWLFPRMAAVVHHGGAGTTGAGLRAGVPTIVVPFTSDQPFWGQRVFRLGVGPRPIPVAKLTAEKLAGAVSAAVGNSAWRSNARTLGERIRREDGIATAIEIMERQVATAPG